MVGIAADPILQHESDRIHDGRIGLDHDDPQSHAVMRLHGCFSLTICRLSAERLRSTIFREEGSSLAVRFSSLRACGMAACLGELCSSICLSMAYRHVCVSDARGTT
jgi:hypothetical protein